MDEERVLAAAAAAHAAEAEFVGSLVQFSQSGAWQGHGIRSFGHWCDINVGVASHVASRATAAASRLERLPAIAAAFADGSLSPEKMILVAEVAGPASDETFAAVACAASVTQLRRICSEYRKQGADETPEAAEQKHLRRGVTSARTDNGLVRLVALLEPDEAAIVLQALDARVETAWRRDRPNSETPAQDLASRRSGALVELATEGLVEGPDPIVRGERIEVRVLIDAGVLSGERDDGICAIDGIGTVPRSTVERLLCDCRYRSGIVGADGSLDLGRTQRSVNRRQRRALRHRDKGCRYPGCGMRRFVDAHHAVPWEAGGPTDIDNLLLLCPAHHRLFHEGGYRVDVLGDGRFTFRRPDGRSLHPPPRRARPDVAPAAAGDPRAQGGGERYDLALTIDALVGAGTS